MGSDISRPKFHHYLSEFYLAGFTPTGTVDDQVRVLDSVERKVFLSKPSETGGENYYYRYDESDSVPDRFAYEKTLSIWESDVSKVFRSIIVTEELPQSPDQLELLVSYVAHLEQHAPFPRNEFLKRVDDIGNDYRFFPSESEFSEYFDSMAEKGMRPDYAFNYEEYRQFANAEEFSIKNFLIAMHKLAASKNTELFTQLNWALFRTEQPAITFVTSDGPVLRVNPWNTSLHNQDEKVIIFPLSKTLMLSGSSGEIPGTHTIPSKRVAAFNSLRLAFHHRHVFFPHPNTLFLDKAHQPVMRTFSYGNLAFALKDLLPESLREATLK
jgi:hypothetical protein